LEGEHGEPDRSAEQRSRDADQQRRNEIHGFDRKRPNVRGDLNVTR
jgi:hypothetical protein